MELLDIIFIVALFSAVAGSFITGYILGQRAERRERCRERGDA